MKTCTKCNETKPTIEFYKETRSKDGLSTACSTCIRNYQNTYWGNKKNKDRRNKRLKEKYDNGANSNHRFRYRKYAFNMSREQYEALFTKQNGVCAICQQPETKKRNDNGTLYLLAIDHDHSCCDSSRTCGKCTRGLLCANCNAALGQFRDDTEIIKRAVDYLLTSLAETQLFLDSIKESA